MEFVCSAAIKYRFLPRVDNTVNAVRALVGADLNNAASETEARERLMNRAYDAEQEDESF